ncbi:MAG: WXG100 family type VII secretion target [Oscillospiraceae bacterium]|nr:WXG100 family type VII secretion target [Oscillospiraceae bacterium]
MSVLEQWGQPVFGTFWPSFQVDTVRVTPEEMYRKAQDVAAAVQALGRLFELVDETAARTDSYWLGAAGERHRFLIRAKRPDMDAILQKMNTHANQLEQMAANYISHEERSLARAEALPADVII